MQIVRGSRRLLIPSGRYSRHAHSIQRRLKLLIAAGILTCRLIAHNIKLHGIIAGTSILLHHAAILLSHAIHHLRDGSSPAVNGRSL